jgi:hypothetical protein
MPRMKKDIDHILSDWAYEPGDVSARLVRAGDGREVLQMRIEMGVLQLEVAGRPDRTRPGGAETYFDYLMALAIHEGDDLVLSDEQCQEVDREFLQFYHRRICWLRLREFRRAVRDADHSLALMDFVRKCSPNEEWTMSHEQYRPFILFHRTQAAALSVLEEKAENQGPERAIEEIGGGLERMRAFFAEHEAEERYDEDEMVQRLSELRESLREHYHVGRTLSERLAEAIAAEQYELAARLRDELAKRVR